MEHVSELEWGLFSLTPPCSPLFHPLFPHAPKLPQLSVPMLTSVFLARFAHSEHTCMLGSTELSKLRSLAREQRVGHWGA